MTSEYAPLHWKQAWKQVGRDGEDDVLHRVARVIGPSDIWDTSPEMYPTQLHGVTACGREDVMEMPGLLSRLYAPRCAVCCAAVGVAEGAGIPGNGKDLKGNPIAPADRWVGEDYFGVGPDAPPSEARED